MNLNNINHGDEIRFQFTLNVTDVTTSLISTTKLDYYDKYGDLQPTVSAPSDLALQSIAAPDCEKCPFFESVEVDDINWTTIVIVSIVIILAGILSRSLYKKKPLTL